MSQADAKSKLTALFKLLGATDPEGWASSQISEGIPQLHRFLFLRQAWRQIIDESGIQWIDLQIESAQERPNDPYAGVGHALRRLRDLGAADNDIIDVVRGTQAEFLFQICYLLADPQIDEPEASHVNWGLFCTNDEGEPTEPLDGLHASVLETDPTGREMRPRSS